MTVLSHPPAVGLSRRLAEVFVGSQKGFLGDIFGFGWIGEQTHGSAIYHVLVLVHERLELLCV